MGIRLKDGEIRRRREAAPLGQAEAAARAGFGSAQHWSNVERGTRSTAPTVETLLRVARALGCTVEDLVELVDTPDQKRAGKAAAVRSEEAGKGKPKGATK
ncbi:MAG: hypothetical protein JWO31_1974 [Phycisphaerales bacterium]|nr:hypothetical protein [Phycisphaerales bacterium]